MQISIEAFLFEASLRAKEYGIYSCRGFRNNEKEKKLIATLLD
jgi:hypothetical protein